MSNRRSHCALNLTASGREAEPRASRLIRDAIVVGVIIEIIEVAIIPARLADWIA